MEETRGRKIVDLSLSFYENVFQHDSFLTLVTWFSIRIFSPFLLHLFLLFTFSSSFLSPSFSLSIYFPRKQMKYLSCECFFSLGVHSFRKCFQHFSVSFLSFSLISPQFLSLLLKGLLFLCYTLPCFCIFKFFSPERTTK